MNDDMSEINTSTDIPYATNSTDKMTVLSTSDNSKTKTTGGEELQINSESSLTTSVSYRKDSGSMETTMTNSLVGRRILCILKTDVVGTVSPIQVSSSLWSPEIVRIINPPGGQKSTTSRIPYNWCKKHHHHHHHQESTKDLRLDREKSISQRHNTNNINIDANVYSQQPNSAKRTSIREHRNSNVPDIGQHTRIPLSDDQIVHPFPRQDTDEVAKQAAPADLGYTKENVSANQNSNPQYCEICDREKNVDDKDSMGDQRNNLLPWRLGTIRAVSHKEEGEEALRVLVEFDLMDWNKREWYRISSHNYPYVKSSNEFGFERQADDDSLKSYREPKRRKIERNPIRDDVLNLSRSKEFRVTETQQIKNDGISEASTENHQQGQNEVVIEGIDSNMDSVDNKAPRSQVGAFSVLLIGSHLCCLKRELSPSGRNKLWPAVVFDTLVDEIGLFDGNGTLRAVEFFDPNPDHCNKTIAQHVCDIRAMTCELDSDFFKRLRYETDSNNIHNEFRRMVDREISYLRDHPGNNKINTLKSNNIDEPKNPQLCDCWSPKVEFVQQSLLHNFDRKSPSSSNLFGIMSTKDLRMHAIVPDQDSSGMSSPSHHSLSNTETRGNRIKEYAETSAIMSTKNNLNSFSEFLLNFHRIHLKSYRPQKSHEDLPLSTPSVELNDLLVTAIKYPDLYTSLKRWHSYQDTQRLLTNVYTASLLVGHRVKVYRTMGTTQWFTAVIISYDERTNLLTLIDDTVLEEHQENPSLLEIHLIDDGLIQSILDGDSINGSRLTRRRPQRTTNQRLASNVAKTSLNGYVNSDHHQSGSSKSSSGDAPTGQRPKKSWSNPTNNHSTNISKSRSKKVAIQNNNDFEDIYYTNGIFSQHQTFRTNKEPSSIFRWEITKPSKSDDSSSLTELENYKNSSTESNISTSLERYPTKSVPVKFGLSKSNKIDGKNLMSHRMRLEALNFSPSEKPSSMTTSTTEKAIDDLPKLTTASCSKPPEGFFIYMNDKNEKDSKVSPVVQMVDEKESVAKP